MNPIWIPNPQMLPPTQNNSTLPTESHCTQSKCRTVLPPGYQYKSCEKCRNISKLSMQKKRKRDKADEGEGGESHSPPTAPTPSDKDSDKDSDTELKHKVSRVTFEGLGKKTYQQIMQEMTPVIFKDKNALMAQLKRIFKMSDRIVFYGCFDIPADPLTPNRDHVRDTTYDIWRVTGYRFR